MLLSEIRRICANEVDSMLDDGYDEDALAGCLYKIVFALSFINMLYVGILTYGLVNAVICSAWWPVAIFSIGYLLAGCLAYVILCAILMLKHINSYRKK